MAPTKRKLKETNVSEEVLDLVIPYIHNIEDRNSVSLVSRKCYETDGITRKRVTVHTLYYPNPASFSKRFPFVEALTLKGPPSFFLRKVDYASDYVMPISPWIEQLALEFRCLKELHIRDRFILDEDLETLARTRGKDLRSLTIKKCRGFSSDGLIHVSNYCNQLRTFCLERPGFPPIDGIWLHQLALNSTVLERLHVMHCDAEDLTLLAKNCGNSLISLKIGKCYLSKLGDAFRYAVRLEHFGGYISDEESELVGFQFPRSVHSLSITLEVSRFSIVFPFFNQIRKLVIDRYGYACQCLLFKRCPNLEVLYTQDACGDRGLSVIGEFCKKLRKLTHNRLVTHAGLIVLAKRCTKLECLKVRLSDISNEAFKCLGTHLKNLRKFRMYLVKKDGTIDPPLDNGIRAMLLGCSKLNKLDISLWQGGLTDVGLEYIGKYGANLRSLSLTRIGNSNAGLLKLSKGCPRLRKLKLKCCPFTIRARSVFKLPSLRYVWGERSDGASLVLARPEIDL